MLKIIIWILVMAIFHSLQEIQIEGGKGGWAKRLPTFRINVFLTKLILGKELTGYHIFMLAMFIAMFHGVFIFKEFSLKTEALIFGLLSIYFVLEDFLWFIFNKHYRLKNFKRGKIKWHKRWFLGLPVSYWTFIIAGSILIWLGI